jgi:hypothetical protein
LGSNDSPLSVLLSYPKSPSTESAMAQIDAYLDLGFWCSWSCSTPLTSPALLRLWLVLGGSSTSHMLAIRSSRLSIPRGADDTKQCATLLELQVQSVVARVNISPRGNSGFISNSQGTVEKALFILVEQPTKQMSFSCVLNSTE